MEDMSKYKLHTKKVKVITGSTADEIDKKATEFQKDHNVISIIQKSELLMIMFYWGEENEGGSS